jgi:hypothetical protein
MDDPNSLPRSTMPILLRVFVIVLEFSEEPFVLIKR